MSPKKFVRQISSRRLRVTRPSHGSGSSGASRPFRFPGALPRRIRPPRRQPAASSPLPRTPPGHHSIARAGAASVTPHSLPHKQACGHAIDAAPAPNAVTRCGPSLAAAPALTLRGRKWAKGGAERKDATASGVQLAAPASVSARSARGRFALAASVEQSGRAAGVLASDEVGYLRSFFSRSCKLSGATAPVPVQAHPRLSSPRPSHHHPTCEANLVSN